MNLFTLSNGNQCSSTGGNFDSSSDTGFKVIPAGTVLPVIAEEAKWEEYEGERFVKIRWSVFGGDYANRKIFQKIKVFDTDPGKSDRARMMLAAIDENCGGELAKLNREFTDLDLASCLLRRKMRICVDVWELNGKEGNWVKSVSSASQQNEPAIKPTFDDDVPF